MWGANPAQASSGGQGCVGQFLRRRNTASGAWIYPIPPDASPETVNWDLFQGAASKRPFSPERFFRWRCPPGLLRRHRHGSVRAPVHHDQLSDGRPFYPENPRDQWRELYRQLAL